MLSLHRLSIIVKMGTCEEISEWSQAPRKGCLLRRGENLLEFPIETAVSISDELPESAEIETIGNCRGPDLSLCTENAPIYCPKSTHKLEQFWQKQSCISQILSGQARGCCYLQKRDSLYKVLGNLWQWCVTRIHLISVQGSFVWVSAEVYFQISALQGVLSNFCI